MENKILPSFYSPLYLLPKISSLELGGALSGRDVLWEVCVPMCKESHQWLVLIILSKRGIEVTLL
jgi:hypothetical protein